MKLVHPILACVFGLFSLTSLQAHGMTCSLEDIYGDAYGINAQILPKADRDAYVRTCLATLTTKIEATQELLAPSGGDPAENLLHQQHVFSMLEGLHRIKSQYESLLES